MPELPEVEVVRRGLDQHVSGRRIAHVEVLHPRAVRRHLAGPDDFAASLTGSGVGAVRRRGKYLWLALTFPDQAVPGNGGTLNGTVTPGRAILGHLGMSGQLVLQPTPAPDGPHLRVRFAFDDGGPQLRFVDQRTFGGLSVCTLDANDVPAEIAHVAPDPLAADFNPATFAAALRRRRTGLKRALLDQSLISGIGNIYADEALWRARLHYARPTETMRGSEVERLTTAVRQVMSAALAEGGTSFDRLYVNVNGQSGYFERSLMVYGRAGQPCRRCYALIRREPFMSRSSYVCPQCQRKPRRARW